MKRLYRNRTSGLVYAVFPTATPGIVYLTPNDGRVPTGQPVNESTIDELFEPVEPAALRTTRR